jgi:hypothetical protein
MYETVADASNPPRSSSNISSPHEKGATSSSKGTFNSSASTASPSSSGSSSSVSPKLLKTSFSGLEEEDDKDLPDLVDIGSELSEDTYL